MILHGSWCWTLFCALKKKVKTLHDHSSYHFGVLYLDVSVTVQDELSQKRLSIIKKNKKGDSLSNSVGSFLCDLLKRQL